MRKGSKEDDISAYLGIIEAEDDFELSVKEIKSLIKTEGIRTATSKFGSILVHIEDLKSAIRKRDEKEIEKKFSGDPKDPWSIVPPLAVGEKIEYIMDDGTKRTMMISRVNDYFTYAMRKDGSEHFFVNKNVIKFIESKRITVVHEEEKTEPVQMRKTSNSSNRKGRKKRVVD